MQEQVFDVQNMCSRYSDVASAMSDGSTSPPLIPYDKALITVLKEKRKSSRSFCRLLATPSAKESKKSGAEPIGSLVEKRTQLENNVSMVSSLSYINGDCSAMDHYQGSSSWFFQSVEDLPIVHGSKRPYNADLYNQVQVRKLNRKLQVLRTENEEYANLTQKIPDYKKELFQIKSANFELKCQVTNLQSQLESSQRQALENEVLSTTDLLPLDNRNEEQEAKVKLISESSIGVLEEELKNTKGQLSGAQEDIFQLNEIIVRLNLDLQAKNGQIGKLEASKESRNLCNLELTLENQKLNQTILELQDKLDASQKSRSNLEQSLSLMRNERESLLKSRDWYQSTCAQAQDTRNEVQSELIHVQSEVASKSMQVEKLKIEAMQVKKILDEEREKSLQEKDDLKRQLEDLELSLINSASEMNSLVLSEDSGHDQDEDLDMQIELLKEDIREKAFKIQELEEKLSQAEQLSACIKKDNDLINVKYGRIQNEVEEMHQSNHLMLEDLKAKEKCIQDLETANVEIEAKSRQHHGELRDLNISWQQEKETNQSLSGKLEKCQHQVLQMDNANEKLEMSLKLCQTEVTKLKKVVDEMKDIRDENILLKKQSLSQDHRNVALKEAFEASDEARQVLEQAHFQLLEENQRLVSAQVSNPEEGEETALKEELEIKTNELENALEQISDLQKANAELKIDNDSLKERIMASVQKDKNDKDSIEKADLELRNSRLECSLKIYHDEMSRLATKIVDLEEAIIVLEHKNGKLVTEQFQNAQMKRQIEKLQDDIAKDTALRQDLLSSIDMAKTSLLSEAHALEQRLHKEKEEHASTKNKLIVLEHEMTEMRVDRRSLRTGIETADLTIEKLQHQIQTLKDHEKRNEKKKIPGSVQDQSKHFQQIYEDGQKVILGLKNQVTELKLQLDQKSLELETFQGMLKANEEANAVEREELKNSSDHFRAELVTMALKMDKLSEEKKNYRTQVQDMNVALKNSLEHIKRLRTQQQPLLVQTEEDLDHEINLETKIQTSSETQKNNLTNLQNCLKSLKYEMAILHKRLAPSVPNSPSKSANETKEE